MTRHITARILLIVLIMGAGLFSNGPVQAQNRPETGAVRIPWEEFRGLLDLDRDEFVLSWQEFQKILRQTGFKDVPPFKLSDEKVVLTRAQFKNLIDRMKPPDDASVKPPADYLLTEAAYTGRIASGSARFQGSYSLELFDRPQSSYVRIPLFPIHIALDDVRLDDRPALIVLDGNRHTLTTRAAGRHRIAVDFSLKTAGQTGPQTLSFPIPRTAITRLDVEIPASGITVEVPGAQRIEITELKGKTRVRALLSPSDKIQIRWRKKPPEAAKGPPKMYAETTTLLSLEEDALRIHAALALAILQNSLAAVTLEIPSGTAILDVRGQRLEDWRELEIEGRPHLEITFDSPRQGSVNLTITAEKSLSESGSPVEFSGWSVRGAIRDKGWLAVALKSAAEVTPAESEGLDRLDVSELPASLIGLSNKPLLLGYRYLRHPFSLVLDVEKHAELPVIGTVADSASGVTLFTEDGKRVHRIVYRIRNTSKQFLELELPVESQIWSVFVGGAPVKPRLRGDRILIPLNRSTQGATGLVAFEVELIYFQKAVRFVWAGEKESRFPRTDILVSELLWSVYLPEGYRYHSFGGTVEREKTARGIRGLLAGKGRTVSPIRPRPEVPGEDKSEKDELRREAGRLKQQFSANLALSEEQMIRQIENEARFGGRVTDIQSGAAPAGGGILPIRIRIPATGRLFRFAKTIVSGESLTMTVDYMGEGTFRGMLWALAALTLAAVFFLRRRLASIGSTLRKRVGFGRADRD